MKYNEKSGLVKTLQEQLIAKGYKLPVYGADGHLGEETWDALAQYARASGLAWDPEVPPTILDVIAKREISPILVAPKADQVDISKILDLSKLQQNPPVGKVRTKFGRDGKVLVRPVKDIRAIMIHQTAITFGTSAAQIKAAGGDKDLAKHKRALEVAAHMTAFNDGTAVLAYPLDWYVHHGNGANAASCGLEIEGLFTGKYDPAKPQLTEAHLEACKQALKYMVMTLRDMGAPVEYVWAHRQFSDSRRADPGGEIWLKLVIQYAVAVLGLKPQIGLSAGGGKPIPKEWDPAGVGSY